MLFKSINARRYPYTFTSFVYAGKPHNHDSQQCEYYVRGTEETVKNMIKCYQNTLICQVEILLMIGSAHL